MTVASVRAEIAKHYRTALGHVAVYEHGGTFGLEDLLRYARKPPALIISALGIPTIEVESTVAVANVVFAGFCVAKDQSRQKRDVGALLLAEAALVETVNQYWNDSASGTPKSANALNMYTAALDKVGIALWAVRWEQRVDLTRNSETTLDDWETFYATYEVGDDDTLDDDTDTDVTELDQ